MLERGSNMAIIAVLILAFDRVDRDIEVVDQAGRDIILS